MNYHAYMNEDHEAIRSLVREFAEKTLAPWLLKLTVPSIFLKKRNKPWRLLVSLA